MWISIILAIYLIFPFLLIQMYKSFINNVLTAHVTECTDALPELELLNNFKLFATSNYFHLFSA